MKDEVASIKADQMYSGIWNQNAAADLNHADGLEHGLLQIRPRLDRQSPQPYSLPPPSHPIPLPHGLLSSEI